METVLACSESDEARDERDHAMVTVDAAKLTHSEGEDENNPFP